jgi:hypothetical protein
VFFLQHADDAEAEVAVLGLRLGEEGGGGGGGERGGFERDDCERFEEIGFTRFSSLSASAF